MTKDEMTMTTTIKHDVYEESQSWCLAATYAVEDHKIRVRIRNNAYKMQSYAVAELWDGSKWNEIDTYAADLWYDTKILSYVSTRENAEVRLQEVHDEVLLRALKVIA